MKAFGQNAELQWDISNLLSLMTRHQGEDDVLA